jgi:hypothetical protein
MMMIIIIIRKDRTSGRSGWHGGSGGGDERPPQDDTGPPRLVFMLLYYSYCRSLASRRRIRFQPGRKNTKGTDDAGTSVRVLQSLVDCMYRYVWTTKIPSTPKIMARANVPDRTPEDGHQHYEQNNPFLPLGIPVRLVTYCNDLHHHPNVVRERYLLGNLNVKHSSTAPCRRDQEPK